MKPAIGAIVFPVLAALLGSVPLTAQSQDTPPASNQQNSQQVPQATNPVPKASTLDETMEAGDAEDKDPARNLVNWNEYDGKYFTFRFGGALRYDVAAYTQDENSKQQFALYPAQQFRDVRLKLKGRLKSFKRAVTYTAGFSWEDSSQTFMFRETGVMVEVPELWGYLFIGRTKEGFSLSKVMSSYANWTMEREMIADAMIPTFADGIKWLGYDPTVHFLWNVGVYADWISQSESLTYEHQVTGRFAWLPIMSDANGTVVHIGLSARYGKTKNESLQVRARPEVFEAPYFVDTGQFPATSTTMLEPEVYYRPGPLLFGSEYFVQMVNAPANGDPLFHGGSAVVSWLATGETRVYNTRGGYFNQISPARPVFQGGPGAWELAAQISYIDLNGGSLRGGKLWRFTPVVNWYLSDQVCLDAEYGYGWLNRFGLVGTTHFFQARLQLQL